MPMVPFGSEKRGTGKFFSDGNRMPCPLLAEVNASKVQMRLHARTGHLRKTELRELEDGLSSMNELRLRARHLGFKFQRLCRRVGLFIAQRRSCIMTAAQAGQQWPCFAAARKVQNHRRSWFAQACLVSVFRWRNARRTCDLCSTRSSSGSYIVQLRDRIYRELVL
jgi:hypothetical protein